VFSGELIVCAFRYVQELPGTDLRKPYVERALSIRPERHEPSVSRNRGAALRAFEVGDATEQRGFERVWKRRSPRLEHPYAGDRNTDNERRSDDGQRARREP
jgi:hypothetical protein